MPEEVEIALPAGAMAPVVRVGETVRRQCGHWTPAVHAWLNRLAEVGFDLAPRVHGIDAKGREILDYIDGECGESPALWSDDTLTEVARIMRQYHDVQFEHVGPWRLLAH